MKQIPQIDLKPGLVVWERVNQRVVHLKNHLRTDGQCTLWSIEEDGEYEFEYPDDWFVELPSSVHQLISEVERLKWSQANKELVHNVGLFNQIKDIKRRAIEIQSNAKCSYRMSAYIDYIIDGKEVDERKLRALEAEE